MRRCTVAREVALSGPAVRTHGGQATVTIAPGQDGFAFVRDDTGQRYPATLEDLVPVRNCTALGASGTPQVLFVEHVLSALIGLGYTDAEVHVDGVEIPLFDGSAQPLVEALAEAGRAVCPGRVEPLTVDRPIWYISGEQCLGAMPAEVWSLDYCFEHPHPMTPYDYVHLDETTDYATAIAPARTFATAEEIRALAEQGLIRGGSEDMLLVVHDDHLSSPLRIPHELATHKALDLIGDLALLGRPLQAKLVAYRTGHSDNHAFAARLAAQLGLSDR